VIAEKIELGYGMFCNVTVAPPCGAPEGPRTITVTAYVGTLEPVLGPVTVLSSLLHPIYANKMHRIKIPK
jgi:hypothetical protein